MAGHRVSKGSPFNPLGELSSCDALIIETQDDWFIYRVLPMPEERARSGFGAALDDDLNVSAGLAAVFDLVREVNRRIEARQLSTDDARRVLATLRDIDQVLAVLPDVDATVSDDVQAILDQRTQARTDRDWAASDRLRDELAARGIAVEDTRDGQRWRRVEEVARG